MTHVAKRFCHLVLSMLVVYEVGQGSLSAAITADEAAAATGRGQINATDVNIRAGSSLNHEILGKVQPNDLVTIQGSEQDWYRIALPDATTCYVHASFVSIDPRTPEQGTVTGNHVNLRARPTTSSSILGQVNEGERVTIREQVDAEWLAIAPPSAAHGWIHKQLVSLIIEETVPQLTAAQPTAAIATEPHTAPAPIADTDLSSDDAPTASIAPSSVDAPSATAALEEPPQKEPASDSWVGTIEDLGRLVARPAHHKLMQDRRVVAFLVSERYNLNRFLHRPVRVWGETLSPAQRRIPIIRVDRLEQAAPPL